MEELDAKKVKSRFNHLKSVNKSGKKTDEQLMQ